MSVGGNEQVETTTPKEVDQGPRNLKEYKQEVRKRREEILEIYRRHYPNKDTKRIEKAMDYAELLHRGQLRRNGRPYIFHPLAVAKLSAKAQLDENCLIAALLHDTIEDTVASRQIIADKFGGAIADIVHALTKIRSYSKERSEEDKQETYKRILKSSSKDIRALLIKILDRLNNMRDMMHMPEGHRRRVSQETLDVYVPFTRRLGMTRVERELSNLSLYYLYPKEYKIIEKRIEEDAKKSEDELYSTVDAIRKMADEHGIETEIVVGWPSVCDFYDSDFGQMNPQADIVVQVNVLIENIIAIYTALGIVHSLFMPVPMGVRDMIALPMANGYRALETSSVIRGRIYNFAFMTREMYEVNDRGIIHNWKTNQNRLAGYYTSYMSLLEEMVADESVRVDDVLKQSHVDGIAVFSPRKDLYILPHQSTVLDFAYQIHREIGNQASHAIVNGVERSISHVLKQGDVVQIVRDEKVRPEEKWLTIAVTSKARAAIRAFLRRQLERRAIELGQEMLSAELEKYGRDAKTVVASQDFKKILERMDLTIDGLYRNIGFRQVLPANFISEYGIVPKKQIEKQANVEKASIREKFFSTLKKNKKQTLKFSEDDIFIKYAHCCNPIFGDNVVGIISAGKGITVHREDCPNLRKASKAEHVPVEWDMESNLNSAVLNMHITDKKGVLASVLNIVSRYNINMSEFNAYTVNHEAFLKIRLDVTNHRDLLKIVHDIRKIDEVVTITREE